MIARLFVLNQQIKLRIVRIDNLFNRKRKEDEMLLKQSFSEEIGDLFLHAQSDLLICTVIFFIGVILAPLGSALMYLVYKLGAF